METLKALWTAREPRERALIAGGLAALAIAALWAYVWDPIATERARLAASLPALRAEAQALVEQGIEAQRLRTAARARPKTGAPEAAIAEAARAAGLADAAAGVTSMGDGRVQVALKPVPFDALVRLLAQLAESQALVVESIAVKAAAEPGRVQVENLVLRRPAVR
jgi:general secretion pathway protein M